MRLAMLVAAAAALTLGAARPGPSAAHPPSRWRCDVIGFWTVRVPAPERRFFSATADTRSAAESQAMHKCSTSPDVSPGTCERQRCQRVY